MREKKEQSMNVVFCRLWVGVKCFIGSTDGLTYSPTSSRTEFVCSSPLTRTQCANHHNHPCKEKQQMLFWQLTKGTELLCLTASHDRTHKLT